MSRLVDPVFLGLKAAVASTLAVEALRVLGGHDLLSAGFVALVCISPSAHAGLRTGLQQVAGSLIGATAAGLPHLVTPAAHGAPWALLPGLAAALIGTFRLGLGGAYVVTGFTVLYFHTLSFGSPRATLAERLAAVLVGITGATLVNVVVSALMGPRIASRRLALVRGAVAASVRATALAPDRAGLLADAAFSAVAELRLDLSAAARERLFPGAPKTRSTASDGLTRAAALEETAHLAHETALLLGDDASGARRRALAPLLARAADALESGRPDALSPAALTASEPALGVVLAAVTRRLLGAVRAAVS
ncbi:MAG: hypothetical protein EOO75_17945 [Myxococcales bacterium]|nr:MAG: hypothetical protein EOO75_17945 [Myxococcales bacterium]